MRFFIALELPEESKQQLMQVQQQLSHLIPSLTLTDPEKLHLTIAFVGEQPKEQKDNLIRTINLATKNIPAFVLAPAYIDGFPNLHQPKVIWSGIKGDIDKLHIIRERIKDSIIELNLDADERRFIPHITLAKGTKIIVTKSLEEKLQTLMLSDFKPIVVKSIKLFESILHNGSHKHNTLAEIMLT